MWGIVPAAGIGSRIQPLAFSKELLPVGSRIENGNERPRAVSEYLVERMIKGGATKICFVVSPGKSDIFEYFGGEIGPTTLCYTVQPKPAGLCDAIFRAVPFIDRNEVVVIGLPDTIWFPEDGFCALRDDRLSFLVFPVDKPEFFDAVVADEHGRVVRIEVKQPGASSSWVWGAFKMPGSILHQLYALWRKRDCRDEYFGTLVNAFLAEGGEAYSVAAGEVYVDVGTLNGYREAMRVLAKQDDVTPKAFANSSPAGLYNAEGVR
ncbi:MAG TPA: sugar phosphate nucleotidyltransferase [Pyrinomonadaceae bacterium]|nr:sugar phosphate nucleotidyltransferase [Pyrinomonadaceae bacterium]